MNILNKRNIIGLLMLALVSLNMGCKKFLDEKSNQKLAIPKSLEDFQALLDNTPNTNESGPSEGEISSDDYYLTDVDWAKLGRETDKNMYIWGNEILFSDKAQSGWTLGYRTVYYCNTVLYGLQKIDPVFEQQQQFNDIKGQASLIRANAFLDMAIIWCKTYDKISSSTDLGLPLHLTPDFNVKLKRANLEQTYQQIIDDLKTSLNLLPNIPISKWRSSRAASYGLLARTYLSMRDYENAYLNADSCLQLYSDLMDYSTLNSSSNTPIAMNNVEVIFNRTMEPTNPISVLTAKISDDLYRSYADNDLRKIVFYRLRPDGTFRFKGSYRQGSLLFSGISTNEIYLIRAECLARNGHIEKAMADLNQLLVTRWKKQDGLTTFITLKTNSKTEALSLILEHRRKELVMRGIRWMDIKRLNKEGANILLKRTINGQTYQLPANDHRFALPLPEETIRLSGIQQNPR
ncbi:RagB/SusD family nutrient uptake outer membrane protein [Pedobacter sp. FW305-3-2-15-E-R2A2]|uniref:RagB/SusD family nutrient uptake outer membrane protein n=1 Tax=Pedobacter sp. FW305-3-2-15-E-R2A2 TaxID=3140251 RepID=UPI003140AB8C